MEEMNLLQAKKMYATLCDVLDARKFPYEKDEENLIVDMDGVGDDLPIARIDGSKVESLAECYYLLGKWQLAMGKHAEAVESFDRGLALDDEPGNHKWRARIKSLLNLYSE